MIVMARVKPFSVSEPRLLSPELGTNYDLTVPSQRRLTRRGAIFGTEWENQAAAASS
jgi:hypothetical protein